MNVKKFQIICSSDIVFYKEWPIVELSLDSKMADILCKLLKDRTKHKTNLKSVKNVYLPYWFFFATKHGKTKGNNSTG